MTKPLSDEDVVLTIACMFQGFTPNPYWKGAVKNQNPEKFAKALDLINTQKRLYAESVISGDDTVQNEGDPETFKHMLTVIMIMFGDAREYEDTDSKRSEKLTREAFEYAESWLEVFRTEQRRRIK